MNELRRILKRGGLFYSATPAFPCKSAFVDPTHVNIITEQTFPCYFCTDPHSGPWVRRYGFNGVFEMGDQPVLTILCDGACPLCLREARFLQGRPTLEQLCRERKVGGNPAATAESRCRI
jgi:hypothetical protein